MIPLKEDFKAVVGKTIFSDGKGKLFFGYYKEDDSVHFVDYKTWKKLSFKDVSKGNTNKERVIKAILKNQKQFNKKVDFNMWAKKNNPSFEQTMDWFIQNGWISNINKGGIKESADVLSVNEGLWTAEQERAVALLDSQFRKYLSAKGIEPTSIEASRAWKSYGFQDKMRKIFPKSKYESVNEGQLNVGDTIKVQAGNTLQKMNTLDDKWKVIKKDNTTYTLKKVGSGIKVRHYQTKVDYLIARRGQSQLPFVVESVTEGKKRFRQQDGIGKAKYTISYHDGKQKHKDGSDFFGIQIFKNKKDLETFRNALLKKGFVEEGITEAKFGYKDSTASYIKKHNNEYKIAEKINKGNEIKFYDELQKMEDKIGHPKFMIFVSNALRGYGVDMYKDPKIKNPQDAQEALFLLSK